MKRAALVLLLLLAAAPAVAQTPTPIINPTTIEWDPSPDHDVMLPGNVAMVTRYDVRVYMNAQPFQVYDAGKPAPVNGKIRVTNPAWFILSAYNATGYAEVLAVGPSGIGTSEASNPFVYASPPRAPGTPVVGRTPSS